MKSPSQAVFDGLDSWSRLVELIANGETEGLYFECKAPAEPRFTKDMRLTLAKACSAFGNTNGGIVLYGVSTTKHSHSGLDVMTQIEPIATIDNFRRQVENTLSSLSSPPIRNVEFRVLKEKSSDTRGVLLVHIPHSPGDPIQSNVDSLFYFRSGDDFVVAPYDMIRRFFAASDSPDLAVFDVPTIYEKDANGIISIPICIQNQSAAIAEHVQVVITIADTQHCDSVSCNASDVSKINPSAGKVFIASSAKVIHKGLNCIIASVAVKPKADVAMPLIFAMQVQVFANRMEMRAFEYTISIAEGGLASGNVQNLN